MKNDNFVTIDENPVNISGNNNKDFKNIDDISEILVREYLMKNISQENIALKSFINDLERRIINFTLGLTNGNQKNASIILGVKETALCEKIKKYDLKKIKRKVPLNLDMLNMGEDEISPDLFS